MSRPNKAELLASRARRDKRMNGVNGRGNMLIPGQMQLQVLPHKAPLSVPVSLAHPVQGGIAFHIMGGFTPLQEMTKAVAPNFKFDVGNEDPDYIRQCADGCVRMAAELLAACDRHEEQAASGEVAEEAGPEQEGKSPIIT